MPPYQIHHQECESPPELRDAIKCFWYNRIDVGETQSGFEVVPDGYAEIIFYFGSTCSISYDEEFEQLPSPFMIGLLNKPVQFCTQNILEIIGIRCYPWAVFDLLGLPTGKDGVRVLDHPVVQLQAALNDCIVAGNIEAAIAIVKEYFINVQQGISINNTVIKAGAAMNVANGNIPVSQIAEAANATVRTLQRNFKESSGYTVKDVSGLIRFEQVRNRLLLDPDVNVAGLASESGYTDQSHLSREFKRYTGTTPAAFAKKAKKGKQF